MNLKREGTKTARVELREKDGLIGCELVCDVLTAVAGDWLAVLSRVCSRVCRGGGWGAALDNEPSPYARLSA